MQRLAGDWMREAEAGGMQRLTPEAADFCKAVAGHRIGHLAAGVPGSVKGMEEAHRRFGSLSWERLVAPAIRYARGFRVRPPLARALAEAGERLSRFPA